MRFCVILNKPFCGTFANLAELHTAPVSCFGKFGLIDYCYRTNAIHGIFLVGILHHISFYEILKSPDEQSMDAFVCAVLLQKDIETCQISTGKRLAIDFVNDLCHAGVELTEELVFKFIAQLIFK